MFITTLQLARDVRNAAQLGVNPLNLPYVSGSTGSLQEEREILDKYVEIIGLALSGRMPVQAYLAASLLEERYHSGDMDLIDRLMARMLAHTGIDPVITTWLATISQREFEIYREGESFRSLRPIAIIHGNSSDLTSLEVGPGTTWMRGGSLILTGVPMIADVSGTKRPLSSLLTHPVLDSEGLTILRTERLEDEQVSLLVDTDYKVKAIDIEELKSLLKEPL